MTTIQLHLSRVYHTPSYILIKINKILSFDDFRTVGIGCLGMLSVTIIFMFGTNT